MHYERLLPSDRMYSCLTSAQPQTCDTSFFVLTNKLFFPVFSVLFLSFLFLSSSSLVLPFCLCVLFSLLFYLSFSLFLSMYFFLLLGCVYPSCSVFGVVIRQMRTRCPLPPGSLTWRRCTPAALQSRYNYGSWSLSHSFSYTSIMCILSDYRHFFLFSLLISSCSVLLFYISAVCFLFILRMHLFW